MIDLRVTPKRSEADHSTGLREIKTSEGKIR
jgi:hypothetical protein